MGGDGWSASRPRWDAAAAGALALVALSPVLLVVITRTGRDYLPVQDIAVIDLRLRDVFSGDAPLVGPYSRYGWNHPGPLMYLLPALLGAPFGHPAWATLVGGALVQGVAIAWLAALAWRRAGPPLVALALGGLGLAYSATGDWILLEAWNPHLAFPFFALFLLQVGTVGAGRPIGPVGAVVTASFLVQTHVGYAPFVVAGAAWAAACLAVDRSTVDLVAVRRRAAAAAVVGVVLWLPPLVEQVVHRPGNVRRLVGYFVAGGSEPPIGLRRAAELLAVEFRPPLPWLGGTDAADPFFGWAAGAPVGWLAVPAALLGAAAAAGWWSGRRTGAGPARRPVAFAAVMVVVGLAALSRVTGAPDRYLFLWRVELAVLVVLAAAASLVDVLPRRPARVARAGGSVALAAAALWGFGGLAVAVAGHGRAVMGAEPHAREIIGQLGPLDGPVIVRFAGDPFRGVQGAVIDELDRRGEPVFVDVGFGHQFGAHRTLAVADAHAVWYVVEQGQFGTLLGARPGAEVLAGSSPFSPDEEREMRALEGELMAALAAAGRADEIDLLDRPLAAFALRDVPGVDRAALDRLAALNARSGGACRCLVIAFPPGLAPLR